MLNLEEAPGGTGGRGVELLARRLVPLPRARGFVVLGPVDDAVNPVASPSPVHAPIVPTGREKPNRQKGDAWGAGAALPG